MPDLQGRTALVSGGGRGLGSAISIVLAECGADVAINYNEEDYFERARGANVILDHIGAKYLPRDLACLAIGGRVVIIGSMGGPGSIDLNVNALLSKRQQIIGSTLRARNWPGHCLASQGSGVFRTLPGARGSRDYSSRRLVAPRLRLLEQAEQRRTPGLPACRKR